MNTNNEKKLDQIETMLLFALESPPPKNTSWRRDGVLGMEKSAISAFRFPDRFPEKFYTFDACDNDRLYTIDYECLLNHPSDIVGHGIEIMTIGEDDGVIKWTGTFPTRKPDRGFVALGHADKWYGVCSLIGNANSGWIDYYKAYAAIDKNGRPLLVKGLGLHRQDPASLRSNSLQIILQCSMAEDASRANAFKAMVTDHASVMFPIGMDGYKDFFALRDAPRNTPTKRLNPILHWVKKHLRQSKNKDSIEVKKHLRGVETVTIGGLTATISPN